MRATAQVLGWAGPEGSAGGREIGNEVAVDHQIDRTVAGDILQNQVLNASKRGLNRAIRGEERQVAFVALASVAKEGDLTATAVGEGQVD